MVERVKYVNQLRAGALLSYLQILLSILIALIYTPIMIRILGQSEFGLYSVLGSLAAYFSVMDLGLGNAMVRFTARNRAIGDKKDEAKLNGLFLLLYTIIGMLTIVFGIFVYNNINALFGESFTIAELSKAKMMIIILIINFSVAFPLSIFNSIIKAYEHFVVDKLISITRVVLAPLLILPIIYSGYGAISMVVITTIVNILCLLFSMYYSFKRLEVKIQIGMPDFSLLKQIVGYSFFVFLAVVVDQVNWQTDQIILGAVKGTMTVAVYAIAMQFIKLYIQFSTSISGLFLPKVSMMVAEEATSNELTSLMIRYGRLQYIILTFILSGFALFGLPFIEIWAGPSYSKAYYIILIIMLPLTIPLVQNFGVSVLYAMNLQGFRSLVLVSIAVLNVILTIPLAKTYGVIGVAIITSLTLILGNIIVMNIYYTKIIGLNMLAFWRSIFKPTLAILISLSLGIVLNILISSNGVFLLSIKILVFSLIHMFIVYKLVLNEYEMKIFISLRIKMLKFTGFSV